MPCQEIVYCTIPNLTSQVPHNMLPVLATDVRRMA